VKEEEPTSNAKEKIMTLQKSWQNLDAAAEKYGIEKSSLLAWIEEGIIRSERGTDQDLLVNLDDLELKIHELTKL
jgi:hypothetical protein